MTKIKFNISIFLLMMSVMTFSACSSDDDAPSSKIAPAATGSFTDSRDGETYGWVRYGKLDWMTENYRYDSQNSTIYLDADEYETNPNSTRNLAKFGRLYNLEGAKAACPEGWRLPTDADWQNLEQQMGMSAGDAGKREWRGNIARRMFSSYGDNSPLNLMLGGYYTTHTTMATPGWRFMGAYGYYWTSTEDTEKTGNFVFFRKLFYAYDGVYRESAETENIKMSVRFVRDAQ